MNYHVSITMKTRSRESWSWETAQRKTNLPSIGRYFIRYIVLIHQDNSSSFSTWVYDFCACSLCTLSITLSYLIPLTFRFYIYYYHQYLVSLIILWGSGKQGTSSSIQAGINLYLNNRTINLQLNVRLPDILEWFSLVGKPSYTVRSEERVWRGFQP